jgi:hypothetical protein
MEMQQSILFSNAVKLTTFCNVHTFSALLTAFYQQTRGNFMEN